MTTADEWFYDPERRRYDSWVARLTEAVASASPAQSLDACGLLTAMEADKAIDALTSLALMLIAGGSLTVEDAAAALSRLELGDYARMAVARAAGAKRPRYRR